MSGWVGSIARVSETNASFRRVLATGKRMQLVVMSLQPREEIGAEVHPRTDQFLRIEEGRALLVMGGQRYRLNAGDAVLVPAGTRHNVANLSRTVSLKLSTLYAPSAHPPRTNERVKPSSHSRRRLSTAGGDLR